MIRKALAASLLFAMAASVSACASGCGATPDKLAALRRGMSYAEASGIMGCSGSALKTESDDVRSVEWTGPGTIAAMRSTRAKLKVNWAGSPLKPSRPVYKKPYCGIWITPSGWPMSPVATIANG